MSIDKITRVKTRSGKLPHLYLAVLEAACGVLLLGAGCSSTGKPDTQPLAWVQVHGQPPERVRDVTAEVFREHGYQVTRRGYVNLVFERQGSTMNNLSYGNWMGKGVFVRVKATVVDISPGNCRVECEAFVLRNRGEVLEEEIRINKLHRHPYQELLDEVAKRLKVSPTNGPSASGAGSS
jgi:hypothetical protein